MILPVALQISAVAVLHGPTPTGSTSSDVTFQYLSNSSIVVRNSFETHDYSPNTSVVATNGASFSESIGGAPGRGSDSANDTLAVWANKSRAKWRIAAGFSEGLIGRLAAILPQTWRGARSGQ